MISRCWGTSGEIRSTACGFYRFAHIDRRIASNPAQYVRRPKVYPSEQRGPTSDTSLNLGPFKLTADDNHPFVGPPSDLWDVNWPSAGYYWTVVGVKYDQTTGTYIDTELPQDACAAGREQRLL